MPIIPKIPPPPDWNTEVLAPLQALQEKARLEAIEAARIAEEARLAQLAEQAKQIVYTAPQPSGNCQEWMAAAGITDVTSAFSLIQRESGCNPYARNSSSGACGVAQEVPCGKSGCTWGDGACQVRWMNQYVLGRYGSWTNALAHSNNYGWY